MRALWIVVFGIAAAMAAGCSRQESGWEAAAGRNTVAAYEDYLRQYPDGAHSDEARGHILALREAEAWAIARRLRVPEAWQHYLADWPEGAHAAEARRELADFVPVEAARVQTGYSAQLGAYSSESAAKASMARLLLEQAALLEGGNWQVIAPVTGAPPLWRLRLGPMPEAEARGLCRSLQERSVDCVPVGD